MFSKYKVIILFLSLVVLSSCFFKNTTDKTDVRTNGKVALISTKYGDMEVLLYDNTILHKQNFEKLVTENFFDSLLFHRVIKNFMIQGGDPVSKNAKPGIMLGNGGPGYTIPAEFDTAFIHKKGALSAAREGDNVNPEKRSSGSQFYIVQGQTFDDNQLLKMEQRISTQAKNAFIRTFINLPENIRIKHKLDSLQKQRDKNGINKLVADIELSQKVKIDSVSNFKYSAHQREIYKTIGGTPHLDGAYTVFGEVIKGLNIIDSIANVKTGKGDRPVEDVIFSIKMLN